jgi:hypothetical protein
MMYSIGVSVACAVVFYLLYVQEKSARKVAENRTKLAFAEMEARNEADKEVGSANDSGNLAMYGQSVLAKRKEQRRNRNKAKS